MIRRWMITCDDCGLSEGINLATADLYERGLAHAASIMTNCSATNHAFASLSQYADLEFGVHLNLTDGFPLTSLGPSTPLTDASGQLHSRRDLWMRAMFPTREYLRLVEAELTAQIQVFRDAGIVPQHLTTHLHFHTISSLRKLVFELADRFGIPRIRAYTLSSTIAPHQPLLRRLFAARQLRRDNSQLMSDYLMGIKWWLGRNPGQLVSSMMYLEGTVEIIVHPSLPQDTTFPAGIIYQPHERFTEMAYLETVHNLLSVLS